MLNVFVSSNTFDFFFFNSLGFSMYEITSSVSEDSFTSSLQIWMPFIYFSCLIALTRTSSTVLNRRVKNGSSCLIPDVKGKAFSLLPLSIRSTEGSSPRLWSVFHHERVLDSTHSSFHLFRASCSFCSLFC